MGRCNHIARLLTAKTHQMGQHVLLLLLQLMLKDVDNTCGTGVDSTGIGV